MLVSPKNQKRERLFLQQLKKGDNLAWKTFYIAHRDQYIKCAYFALKDEIKSYELVQDFFANLLNNKGYKLLDTTSYASFKEDLLNFFMNNCTTSSTLHILAHAQKSLST